MARGNQKKRGKGSQGQNRKATEDFFAKNRKKPEVIETPTGLQYIVREPGTGPSPTPDSEVTIQQRILLLDGTVIRDTYKEPEPETFSLTEAIDGLKEGIPLMSEGAKFRFFVPPTLAWGKRGAGSKIGPNATLIFDIKLVSFY